MKKNLNIKSSMTPSLSTFRLLKPDVELLLKGLESLYVNEIHGKMISGQDINQEEELRLQRLEKKVINLKQFLEAGLNGQKRKHRKEKKQNLSGAMFYKLSPDDRSLIVESLHKNYYGTMIGLLRRTLSWEKEGKKAKRICKLIDELELPF